MRVGIAGAAGYTAGELIRILIGHPGAELRYIQSESHQGLPRGTSPLCSTISQSGWCRWALVTAAA